MDNSIEIIKWTLIGANATIIIFLIFIRHVLNLYNKKNNEFETELHLKALEKERSILSTRIEVHEETIQKISKELHDNVNQLLTLAKLNLNNIGKSSVESINSKIEITKELITKTINELTNMSSSLSSQSIQDVGLLRTLEIESDRIMKINNTKIIIEYDLMSNSLNNEEQLILYRIFQESTRNSIIHGNARNILVTLSEDNNHYFNFTIKDDGSGFDSNKKSHENSSRIHHGLKNMVKRALIINAECKVESKINEGTTIKIIKPKKQDTSQ